MNRFNFYNSYHLGDQLFNLKFFFNIHDHLEKESITINYYYPLNTDHKELERYTKSNVVTLIPIHSNQFDTIPNPKYSLWMGDTKNGENYDNIFDKYYMEYYKEILKILKLDNIKICCSLYQPEDYLIDIYNNLNIKHCDKYKDIDILILNNLPCSAQFNYNKREFDDLCCYLNNTFKVAVCSYVNDSIPCTMLDNLTIQDIGAISTRSKYIIAVFSGPLTGCFNSLSKMYVKKWFFLHRFEKMIPSEIDCVHSSNLSIARKYFEDIMINEPTIKQDDNHICS